MIKNKLLFNASLALLECSKYVKHVDPDYAIELLDKALEYKDQIVINEELEKEVDDIAKEIKKGL